MTSKSIYEEAIADAKKIREVAEENAKKAIMETVTPRIKEFIEQQLLEQNDDDSDDVSEDDHADVDEVVLDESAIASLLGLLGKDVDESFLSESFDNVDALKEALSMLSGAEQQKIIETANKINGSSKKMSHSRIVNNNSKENNMSRDRYYEVDLQMLREAVEDTDETYHMEADDEDVSEISDTELQELYDMLNEQDEEEASEEEPAEPEEGAEEPMPESDDAGDDMISKDEVRAQIEELLADLGIDLGGDAEPAEGAPEEGGEGEEMPAGMEDLFGGGEAEEEPAAALDEVFEIDAKVLKQELARVRRQLREGKGIAKDMEHHFGGKGKANAGVKGAFGGGSEGQDAFTNPPKTLLEMRRKLRQQSLQNRALNEKLGKYRSAVVTLREQLEDLNLFNAKLLYVNKLLQNASINESQKKSIIKALDKANSLQEAKTLYKSLTETFGRKSGSTLTESRRLGSSSRTTSSASSNNAIAEVNRWATLAGLK